MHTRSHILQFDSIFLVWTGNQCTGNFELSPVTSKVAGTHDHTSYNLTQFSLFGQVISVQEILNFHL